MCLKTSHTGYPDYQLSNILFRRIGGTVDPESSYSGTRSRASTEEGNLELIDKQRHFDTYTTSDKSHNKYAGYSASQT
jgi:hypothetical protein